MHTKSFILGAVFGALISAVVFLVVFRPPPMGHFADQQEMGKHLLRHFTRMLSLDSSQQEQALPIVLKMHRKILALKLSQSDDIDRVINEADAELSKILSADQIEKLSHERNRIAESRRKELEFLNQPEENSSR